MSESGARFGWHFRKGVEAGMGRIQYKFTHGSAHSWVHNALCSGSAMGMHVLAV